MTTPEQPLQAQKSEKEEAGQSSRQKKLEEMMKKVQSRYGNSAIARGARKNTD